MRKLFLIPIIVFLLSFNAHAMDDARILLASLDDSKLIALFTPMAQIATDGAVVLVCTESATKCDSGMDDYWPVGDDVETNLQKVKSFGVEKTICQIDVYMMQDDPVGDIHLEIWNTDFTTQYGDDSITKTITEGFPGTEYIFTWSGTKPVVPSGDFNIHFAEESGDPCVCVVGDETCYEDTNYDFTDHDTERDDDAMFTIHTDEEE